MQNNYYTLTEKLLLVVKKTPEIVALQIKTSTGYQPYTYQELYDNAKKVAEALIYSGIQKKERVAIVLENRAEWVFIYFGILLAKAIAVPLDPQATADDLEYFFKDSENKIVFTSPLLLATVYAATQRIEKPPKIVLLDQEKIGEPLAEFCGFHDFLGFANKAQASRIINLNTQTSLDDIASILYTSGTTGKPKGVLLTHKNFYANFQSVEKLNIFFEGNQNILAILPLHHAFPFMVTVIIPLFLKIKVTYVATNKREEIIQCLQETKATFFVGVPLFFNFFCHVIKKELNKLPLIMRLLLFGLTNLGYKLRQLTGINLNKRLLAKIHKTFGKRLKYLISGGAALDPKVEIFFNKIGFTIIQGYGLTETAPIVTLNPLTKSKIGSVGKTMPDVSIKIIAPDASGVGEVAIHGPNVMQGYYQRDAETAEALKDGWFYSGDLGYFDQKGYLFLTGRKKELIKLSSGKYILPEEVENHYMQDHYIKELCVLAVGEGTQEKLVAVIVPDFAYFKKIGEIKIYETIKFALATYSKDYPIYKTLMGFILTKDDLPRTNLGKLKRHEIRHKYLEEIMGKPAKVATEQLNPEDLALLNLPTYKAIISVITKERQRARPVLLNDHLNIDLGFDSLSRIELVANLEKQFNIQIPEPLIAKIATVKDLVLTLEQAITEPKANSEKIVTLLTQELWQNILNTKPTKTIINKIDITPSLFAKMVTMTASIFIFIVTKLLWRLKVVGTENLPKDQPFILCPNHTSYIDAFLVLAAIPTWLKFKIFFLGLNTIFDVPIVRHIIKIGRIIPLDLATNLLETMRACSYVLRSQRVMCIFPEGGRSPDGTIQPFKKGVGILARELKMPLVPIHIDGAFKVLPIGTVLPKLSPIKITFGKPYIPDPVKAYEKIVKELEIEVINLA